MGKKKLKTQKLLETEKDKKGRETCQRKEERPAT